MRNQMMDCGLQGKQITFLMTDTQIVNENFLEDINNVLNTGEITNLYEEEHLNKIQEEIRPYVKSLGRMDQKEVNYATYIERV
jgi:dynein heavy chain